MADATTHILQEIIEKTIQTTLLKAHPVGSYWLTESDDDPNTLLGGAWERVKGKLLQCSDDTHPAGTDIEAGLPNITGRLGFTYGNYRPSGAIQGSYQTWTDSDNLTVASRNSEYCLRFDASCSNAIYGKSDTVQPETHVVNVWKRIS